MGFLIKGSSIWAEITYKHQVSPAPKQCYCIGEVFLRLSLSALTTRAGWQRHGVTNLHPNPWSGQSRKTGASRARGGQTLKLEHCWPVPLLLELGFFSGLV